MGAESEQIKAVHAILDFLLEKQVLSNDPLTVELSREGNPPVFPCGRIVQAKAYTQNALNMDQINWALKEGKWWFIGPIQRLKITKVKRKNLTESDIESLKLIANKEEFSFSILNSSKSKKN